MNPGTIPGVAKFSKNRLRLSPTLLANYGFKRGGVQGLRCGRGEDRPGEKKNNKLIFHGIVVKWPTSSCKEGDIGLLFNNDCQG